MITIPNAKVELSETKTIYTITPNEGYVLHNTNRDWEDENLDTGEKTFHRGYSTSSSTADASYDFENTTEIDGYTAYGMFEIFARPIDEVKEGVF